MNSVIITFLLCFTLILTPVAYGEVPALPRDLAAKRSPQSTLTVVEFSAPWCSSCQKIKPTVQAVERQYKNRLTVIHVNVDEAANQKYVSLFDLASIPTYVLYDDGGKAITKIERDLSPTEFQQIISKNIGR